MMGKHMMSSLPQMAPTTIVKPERGPACCKHNRPTLCRGVAQYVPSNFQAAYDLVQVAMEAF